MRLRSVPLASADRLGFLALVIALSAQQAVAAQQSTGIPPWLAAHVGEGPGQIAQPVLQRARSLYLQKLSAGAVRNPCYFAMDATRPNGGDRFYIICEASQAFRAIGAGHGSGRNLAGVANFGNGRDCAKNFGNAMDSDLTAGGAYVTSEAKTSFKGYYRAAGQDAAFIRTFIQFDGEGETSNARERAIGGHPSAVLRAQCMRKGNGSPYANQDGYVPFGKLVDYAGGRSNGCTSWSPANAAQIISMVKGSPTTVYIYPQADDIRAVAAHRPGAYWNAACLRSIGAPKYWPRQTLEPLIAQWKADHPAPPPQPLPICAGG